MLLTKKYFVLLAISFVLIVPLSIYFAQEWLSGFAYHIELGPALFIKAILVVLGITLFTVSFQSIKAALSNPAHVLKND
jgi:putative ABC transport system permease protein